jgi:hypothetical protein
MRLYWKLCVYRSEFLCMERQHYGIVVFMSDSFMKEIMHFNEKCYEYCVCVYAV